MKFSLFYLRKKLNYLGLGYCLLIIPTSSLSGKVTDLHLVTLIIITLYQCKYKLADTTNSRRKTRLDKKRYSDVQIVR